MRILVTNDDGIESEGLAALASALSPMHEVWVLAPDKERSGASHGLSLRAPLRLRRTGGRSFSCSGTPSDCVLLAMHGAIGPIPEMVVSGINRGANLGTDIVYSGTCAAAREASLWGMPGIAVSCVSADESYRYGSAASFVSRNLESLIAACSGPVFVNVNAPSGDAEDLEAAWCPPCSREYADKLESFEAPDGYTYCFITGGSAGAGGGDGSDYGVVSGGRVAVSPILALPQTPSGFLAGPEFR